MKWKAPTFTGGCPILTYALFSDYGVSGAPFVEVDNENINNRPYLNTYTVINLVNTGATYNFYLTVTNEVGST
jgi:hypothetical protein